VGEIMRSVTGGQPRPLGAPLTDEELEQLRAEWLAYGHAKETITKATDGLWIKISPDATIQVMPGRVVFHGDATDDAIAASMRNAQEAWGGTMNVHGPEDFKLRSWAHAQVAGVIVENYEPPAHLRRQADDLVSKYATHVFNLQFASGKTLGDPPDNRPWGYSQGFSPAERDRMRRIETAFGLAHRPQSPTI
jgi:hypothetical protein